MQAQFRAMEGGYHRANVELKGYLRDLWALPELPKLTKESAESLTTAPGEEAQRQHSALCQHVGTVLAENGELDQALAHYEASLEMVQALDGAESKAAASCYTDMGTVYSDRQDYVRALELYAKAAAIEEVQAPDGKDLADTFTCMGIAHMQQQEFAPALERLGQAAKIYKAVKPDEAVNAYGNMAIICQRVRQFDKALECHGKALAIYESAHGERHPNTAQTHHNMGTVLAMQGEHAAATEALTKALQIQEEVFGTRSRQVGETCDNIGVLFEKCLQDREKAHDFFSRAAVAYAEALGPQHAKTLELRDRAERVLR